MAESAVDPRLDGLFCDACGRDVGDVADEDFFVPTEAALARGYLSGRCARHPPDERQHFDVVHIGGEAEEPGAEPA